MNYKLIKLQDKFILVSDEEIREGDWILANGKPEQVLKIQQAEDINYKTTTAWFTNCKKIIAGIPELPAIDFSLLSEEDCKEIGCVDVEKYVREYVQDLIECKSVKESERTWISAICHQMFKTAQFLNDKMFTEEDLKKAIRMVQTKWTTTGKFGYGIRQYPTESEVIQFVSQPKIFDVDLEKEDLNDYDDDLDGLMPIWRLKITNNSIKIVKML